MSVNLKPLSACTAMGTLILGLSNLGLLENAVASRLPSGRVVFDQSPQLVQMVSLAPESAEQSLVQIVLTIPPDAGEPMEALLIRPRDGTASLSFAPDATTAFVGNTAANMALVPLASVGGNSLRPNDVLVVFATPVAPNHQVRVLLTHQTDPPTGTYELGVTAYPSGDNPVGQFLGYQFLQF